ncbi:hypothetical protein [Streptomyces sp. SID14515]|uniref:hypothetical protein n=1 Tax=Streptomyces sp. SID14515 TaxID=2706074 RepID=UPI0013C76E3A|nr:hypothetical protein [Streptomyces sp. SID14515]NEB40646.1 hypothetical protein [Streptomyces sp. SID14515]
MRRQTCGSTGRRGSAVAASAAALCLGAGLLSGCGSGPGDGYVAVGAAAEDSKGPSGGDGRPSGEVTLTPLDESGGGAASGGRGGGASPSAGSSPGASVPRGSQDGPGGGGARTGSAGGQGAAGAPGSADAAGVHGSPSSPGSPGSPSSPGSSDAPGAKPAEPAKPSTPSKPGGGGSSGTPKPPAPPATPAALTLSAPQRAAADKRWCEKVTVEFRNTGGSPARSGTVTFATHIIGALGVDWATITSSQPLPAPIDAGSTRSKTYTVCVESWRVPLGMRVETQDVSAEWE